MNRLLFLGVLLSLVCAPGLMAQTPGTGNLAGMELDLSTSVGGGTLDNTDKPLNLLDTATVSVTSPDASFVGQPVLIAAGLAPAGSDPTSDFGTELGIIGLPFTNLAVLVDGISDPNLGIVVGANGINFGLTLPCIDFGAAGLDGVYLQAAALDATKPNGWVFTVATELAATSQLVTSFSATIGDDDFALYQLCLTTVDFYGLTYSEFYVGSNGFVTFGAGDGDFGATEMELLDQEPRICGLWGDLSPDDGGSLTVTESSTGAIVDFFQVPSFMSTFSGLGGGLNTFSMGLNANGDVHLVYGADILPDAPNSNNDEIIGISPGGTLSLANEIDLSAGGFVGAADQAIYEVYDDVCGDTAQEAANATLNFVYTGANAYTYSGGGFTAPATTVDSFTPATGSDLGGDTVTFTGCGFDAMNTYSVDFGGTAVAGNVVDLVTLDCVTPAGMGTVDVTVLENGSPIATFVGSFTYLAAGVVITPGPDGDDNSVNVVFANNSYSFYGTVYTDCFVNSNGNVTFGSGDNDWTESSAEMLSDQPRIAAFWDDMRPPFGGGTITITETLTDITFGYVNVPAYTTGANTCNIVMDAATSNITMAYGAANTSYNGAVSARDVVSGISPGGGATDAGVDLSAPAGTVGGALDAFFEELNDGGPLWDLDGLTLSFTWNGTGYTH